MEDKLTVEEQQTLLRLARDAMERGVKGEKLFPLDEATLTPHLREHGSSFITLTLRGELRGCIGALEPYQALAEDVREHAVAAALKDPRFPAVDKDELSGIRIEVSRLTRPIPLEYKDANELLSDGAGGPEDPDVDARARCNHADSLLPLLRIQKKKPAGP